jgi:O-antigen chain-terminating bifunctional methyltransferase/kinase
MEKPSLASIEELVGKLPEKYQIIYGHPELSESVSRDCEDRLEVIGDVYGKLNELLGRSPKVLDLGCAQGFFCFHLAAMGASVLGVDYNKDNIALCDALAKENPDLSVASIECTIENYISTIKPGEYDIVLGLSVFHHLIQQHGKETVKGWIDELARKVGICVIENALSTEPMYWAASQPTDPLFLLSDIGFAQELGRFRTHLSDIQRPLYFASNKYWYLGGRIGAYFSVKKHSHHVSRGVHQGTRAYYIGNDRIAKVYRLEGDLKNVNRDELDAEAEFLLNVPEGFKPHPKMIDYAIDDKRAWLIREMIPGTLLTDIILAGGQYDPKKIALDVLGQLCVLEEQGLYHNDVRVWNVLVDADQNACLIDFGAISRKNEDCVWPRNLILSFFVFIHDLSLGAFDRVFPTRAPFVSPFNLPPPFRNWALRVWKDDVDSWTFARLRDYLLYDDEVNVEDWANANGIWMQAIEKNLDIIGNGQDRFDRSLKEANDRLHDMQVELSGKDEKIGSLRRYQEEYHNKAIALMSSFDEKSGAKIDAAVHDLSASIVNMGKESIKMNEALYEGLISMMKNNDANINNKIETLNGEIACLIEKNEKMLILQSELEKVRSHCASLEGLLSSVSAEKESFEQLAASRQMKIDELNGISHNWYLAACSYEQQLKDFHSSKSWKITKPLRLMSSFIKWFVRGVWAWVRFAPGCRPRRILRKMLEKFLAFVMKHPRMKRKLVSISRHFPRAKAKLASIHYQSTRSVGAKGAATIRGKEKGP